MDLSWLCGSIRLVHLHCLPCGTHCRCTKRMLPFLIGTNITSIFLFSRRKLISEVVCLIRCHSLFFCLYVPKVTFQTTAESNGDQAFRYWLTVFWWVYAPCGRRLDLKVEHQLTTNRRESLKIYISILQTILSRKYMRQTLASPDFQIAFSTHFY
jgi:hypothetical protein